MTGKGVAVVFKLSAARGQEVPAEGTVANGGLDQENRLVVMPAHDVSKAEFRSVVNPTHVRGKRALAGVGLNAVVVNVVASGPSAA